MQLYLKGSIHDLVILLKEKFNLQYFIESGTYKAETTIWAATEFKHVITMELSESLYKQTTEKLRVLNNVDSIFGDSRIFLKKIVRNLKGPALFWLDSHWSGGETYGQNDQCALLSELETIKGGKVEHFILIDDARLFLSPPPGAHKTDQWPTITEIIEKLIGNHKCYIVVIEDVIVAVPIWARDAVTSYCKVVTTKVSNDKMKLAKEKRFMRVLKLYREGTLELVRGIRNRLLFTRKSKY